MKTAYDKYYKKEDYFGRSYSELVDFFRDYDPKGHILDLGCGQGRDSLMLGSLGYRVTGVDVSSVGVQQLNEKAAELNLDVKGIVGDIYKFPITDEYDFILLDSMLHFYKKDKSNEIKFLKSIVKQLKPGGVLCNCIISGSGREKLVREIVNSEQKDPEVLLDAYAEYPEFTAKYHIYIIRKLINPRV